MACAARAGPVWRALPRLRGSGGDSWRFVAPSSGRRSARYGLEARTFSSSPVRNAAEDAPGLVQPGGTVRDTALQQQVNPSADTKPSSPTKAERNLPTSIKQLNKLITARKRGAAQPSNGPAPTPEGTSAPRRGLREEDLEERFVRGSGPGGQAINKTSSSVNPGHEGREKGRLKRTVQVSLIHRPTGIRVQCQESRSLQRNRRLAREILLDKIDAQLNPGASVQDLRWEKERRRKLNRGKKSRRKYAANKVEADDGEAAPSAISAGSAI